MASGVSLTGRVGIKGLRLQTTSWKESDTGSLVHFETESEFQSKGGL